MKTDHVIAFALGALVGWLVLPMVLSMFTGHKMASGG
jgi:hypothetical protein